MSAVALRMAGVFGLVIAEGSRALIGRFTRPHDRSQRFGVFARRVCERAGGMVPKLGQVLGSRPDLVSREVCSQFERLHDRMPPEGPRETSRMLRQLADLALRDVQRRPIASASIAQVHVAVRSDTGQEVALKLLRPRVHERLRVDMRLARLAGGLLGRLPAFTAIPFAEALELAGAAVGAQTDMKQEGRNLERLARVFASTPWVVVPRVHTDLCRDDVLAMDYIGGLRKLTDPALERDEARRLTVLALHALYVMIFLAGFVHCDMHPGNVMATPDGKVALLDAGLVAELSDTTRRDFAEFFMAIAQSRGDRAADIVLRTALHVPPTLSQEAFRSEIKELVDRVSGLKAGEFGVALFASDLFAIQTRHGLRGSPKFTMAIVALLVYEGLAKQLIPDLDFQAESGPFVLAALTIRQAA